MILSTDIFIQIAIIVGVVILFIVSFIVNKHTKAPKGVDIPEKCLSCTSEVCIIKTSTVEEIKKNLKEELERCSEQDEQ